MTSYKFSIWLIPENWKKIKEMYKMEHIPHITVATNIESELPYEILNNKNYKVSKFSKVTNFEKMYKHDPLNGYGFYCEINDIKTTHKPHMTLFYNKELDNENIEIPLELECKLYMANTQSIDWKLWTAKNLHQ